MNIFSENLKSSLVIRTCLSLLVLLFAGCDSDSTTINAGENNLVVPIPSDIRHVQAVSSRDLQLEVSVNGAVVRNVPVDSVDSVNVDIRIPADQANDIQLSWFAIVEGNRILLADFETTVAAEQSAISVTSYNSTGDRFDFDQDGRTNLVEARENRNMLSAIDLEVPFSTADFQPANVTILNDSVDGNVSGDPVEVDAQTRFSVWHDGVDLEVYVCGQDRTLSESSAEYWHDDTLFMFFDGRNNDTGTYDGVDDYQIAFVRSTEEMIVSKGAQNAGCPNGECITFNFFNNSSSCQYELRATFPISSMNMTVGETFGFDVEFTDDDNGGLRDDNGVWIGYNDRSDVDPRTFGTARLVPQ